MVEAASFTGRRDTMWPSTQSGRRLMMSSPSSSSMVVVLVSICPIYTRPTPTNKASFGFDFRVAFNIILRIANSYSIRNQLGSEFRFRNQLQNEGERSLWT